MQIASNTSQTTSGLLALFQIRFLFLKLRSHIGAFIRHLPRVAILSAGEAATVDWIAVSPLFMCSLYVWRVCVQRSEDSLWKSALSFLRVGSED